MLRHENISGRFDFCNPLFAGSWIEKPSRISYPGPVFKDIYLVVTVLSLYVLIRNLGFK